MIGRIPFMSKPIVLLRIPHIIMFTVIIGRGEIGRDVGDGVGVECCADGLRDRAFDVGHGIFDVTIDREGVMAGSNHHIGAVAVDVGCGVGHFEAGIGAGTLRGERDGFGAAAFGRETCV